MDARFDRFDVRGGPVGGGGGHGRIAIRESILRWSALLTEGGPREACLAGRFPVGRLDCWRGPSRTPPFPDDLCDTAVGGPRAPDRGG